MNYPFVSVLASVAIASVAFINACSVIVGNVKPVDEPSPLTSMDSPGKNWSKSPSSKSPSDEGLIWSNSKTNGVLSFVQTCREKEKKFPHDKILKNLRASFSDWKTVDSEPISANSKKGATVTGVISRGVAWVSDSQSVKISKIVEISVFSSPKCVTELVLVSSPRKDQDLKKGGATIPDQEDVSNYRKNLIKDHP